MGRENMQYNTCGFEVSFLHLEHVHVQQVSRGRNQCNFLHTIDCASTLVIQVMTPYNCCVNAAEVQQETRDRPHPAICSIDSVHKT